MGALTRLLAVLFAAVALLPACSVTRPEPVTLRVLASSELADLTPVLADLRADTGVELELDLRGTVDAANALAPGDYRHDLAWLSSDRYFQLKLTKSGYTGPKPLSTSIMLSPVVVGVKRATAERLRSGGPVSWADIADRAAAGELQFAMGDPQRTGSGLAALVGVATAAAGTGRALRPEDVTCDRLRGLFAGHKLTADTSPALVDEFVAQQGELDALVSYESVLLSLNGSGRLTEPLDILYPADGIIQSEYPLLLLDPAKRAAYDRVVDWLRSEPVQQRIMERTARRPIDPDVPRSPRLRGATGNALYFPDRPEVIDALLANYDAIDDHPPGHVIFLLDFSGSMRGSPRCAPGSPISPAPARRPSLDSTRGSSSPWSASAAECWPSASSPRATRRTSLRCASSSTPTRSTTTPPYGPRWTTHTTSRRRSSPPTPTDRCRSC